MRAFGGSRILTLLAVSSTSFFEGGSEQCIFLVTSGSDSSTTGDPLGQQRWWLRVGGFRMNSRGGRQWGPIVAPRLPVANGVPRVSP